jgi:hypothetical protein
MYGKLAVKGIPGSPPATAAPMFQFAILRSAVTASHFVETKTPMNQVP